MGSGIFQPGAIWSHVLKVQIMRPLPDISQQQGDGGIVISTGCSLFGRLDMLGMIPFVYQ